MSYRQALPLLDDELQRAELELQLGTVYLDLGHQLDKAVRELRKSVSSNPDDAKSARAARSSAGAASPKAQRSAGQSDLGCGAAVSAQGVAQPSKQIPQVLTTLGKLLLSSGQVPDAEKALLRAVQAAPERVETLLLLGELRIQQGDTASAYEQGLRAYSQCPQREPTRWGWPTSHRLLARCHTRSGSPERALAALREAEASAADRGNRAATKILTDAIELALRQGFLSDAVALARRSEVASSQLALVAQSLDESLPIAEAEALLGRLKPR
jgi:tetratricopeptide (TPR) repeat protein